MQQRKKLDDNFEQMTLCYVEQMFRLAYSRVGNASDAQDIVQETYLKAFKSFHTYGGQASVKNWLTQILLNTVRDHFRKSSRRISTVEISDALDDSDDWLSFPGPEDELCASEVDASIARALASMPEQFVVPLLLREIHDATYEEIATILSIPKGTVMSRLSRARALLRKNILAEPSPPEWAKHYQQDTRSFSNEV